MARKRTVKPNFNDDDDIAALSDSARLFYILLWGHMDRNGVIEDSLQSIRSKVYPREERPSTEVSKYLDELLKTGPSGRPRLYRFAWRGRSYLYCPTMPRHQKIYSDEQPIIPIRPGELAAIVESHEKKKDAAPQPGTGSEGGRSPEQEEDGNRSAPGRPPEQSRAFSSSSPSASISASAPASPSAVRAPDVDNSNLRVENKAEELELCKAVDHAIARGNLEQARNIVLALPIPARTKYQHLLQQSPTP